MSSYDYIIAGAGAAGLSLAVHMIHSGKFSDKKILIIDKEEKNKNDRTWCFWETEPGLFESIVYRKWDTVLFFGKEFTASLVLTPYSYKLVRALDFYEYAWKLIRQNSNFEIRRSEIKSIHTGDNKAWVDLGNERADAAFIFSSIITEKPALKRKQIWLLQHFKGWLIETETKSFDPGVATLMDFRVDQKHGTTFVYVMPFTPTTALVEYTLFTEKPLSQGEYDEGLKHYIDKHLMSSDYKVTSEEFGVIPMTNYKFPRRKGNIIYTGTAGGQTKASSGYTFRFIQKHSAAIVDSLIRTGNPFDGVKNEKRRFNFYDSVLLNILKRNKLPGDKVFTRLFKKNNPQQVLRFLDNETTLKEELDIISTLPTWPFMKAAIRQL
jgi:lycopene beta-cyclase